MRGETYGWRVFCEGACVPSVYFRWALSGTPSYLTSCKIWTKLDNPQLSYSDSTYLTWPQSAIFDFRGKHIWTTPHVAWHHCLRAHINCGENILIGNDDMPPKHNLQKRPLAAEFYFRLSSLPGQSFEYVRVCHRANFSQIGQLGTKE